MTPGLVVETEDELAFVRAIAGEVARRGGRALVVGGHVRDALLGVTSKDLDLEVFGLDAEALKALLGAWGTVNTVGESFTVFKVRGLDVALPRRESSPRTLNTVKLSPTVLTVPHAPSKALSASTSSPNTSRSRSLDVTPSSASRT